MKNLPIIGRVDNYSTDNRRLIGSSRKRMLSCVHLQSVGATLKIIKYLPVGIYHQSSIKCLDVTFMALTLFLEMCKNFVETRKPSFMIYHSLGSYVTIRVYQVQLLLDEAS